MRSFQHRPSSPLTTMADQRVALVMADSRVPWPPPPSANATARLSWQATTYSHAVAMASLYAQRHCYDLRVYHFLRRRAKRSKKSAAVDDKKDAACIHPTLGGRAAPWCKLLALYDTLSIKPLYSWVAWIDSDLAFHDHSRGLPALVREFSPSTAASDKVVAWFPTNWPWHAHEPNSGFFILRNEPKRDRARELIRWWWNVPNGRKWNHRHKCEQEPLMMWWRDLSGESKASKGGAGTADKPYGVAALLTNWKHMTDQIYNNVSNERLGDGSGAPTTHMAEGNNIVPAHPHSRKQTFPSLLTALSLEQVVSAPAECRVRGRTYFFRSRAPETSLVGETLSVQEVPRGEWWAAK